MKLSEIKDKLASCEGSEKKKELLKSYGITIKYQDSVNLGRCYNAYRYIVKSSEEISYDLLYILRSNQLLGYGQEFVYGKNEKTDDGYMIFVADKVDSSD